MLTPERIKQIQVEAAMAVMMGQAKTDLYSALWPLYKEEIKTIDEWFDKIIRPMTIGGFLSFDGIWYVTKDGEEFVKNYSAAVVDDAN